MVLVQGSNALACSAVGGRPPLARILEMGSDPASWAPPRQLPARVQGSGGCSVLTRLLPLFLPYGVLIQVMLEFVLVQVRYLGLLVLAGGWSGLGFSEELPNAVAGSAG